MESPYKSKTGLRRVLNATRNSLSGLVSAYRNEPAFRQEIGLGLPLVIIALVLPVGLTEKALMVSSVLLVLMVELLNSGIEAVVDRVSLEKHALAKRAKDIGSAAVFVSLLNLLAVWGFALYGLF